MKKYWRHFKTVCKHKYFVFKECVACGIWWQGIIHDFSKFGFTEFVSSAKHFQGNRSPIEAEKEEIGYSKAWLHHKGHKILQAQKQQHGSGAGAYAAIFV